MKYILSNISLVFVFLSFGSYQVHAQTATANPIADAFVNSAHPDNNYGAASALGVSASGLPKGEFDSVIKFDLSTAKSGFDALYDAGQWTIQSITLKLTATAPNNSIFNGFGAGSGGTNVNFAGQFSIKWMQNETVSWAEGNGTPNTASTTGGITFNTLPTFLGGADETVGTYSFNGATSGAVTYALGLTSGFTADAHRWKQCELRDIRGRLGSELSLQLTQRCQQPGADCECGAGAGQHDIADGRGFCVGGLAVASTESLTCVVEHLP
jgi:hypothetical protein